MQELTQDKDQLQSQVCDQLKQLSQLRSQVGELTLSSTATASQSVPDVEWPPSDVEELRLKVDELGKTLQVRDKEVVWLFMCMLHIKRYMYFFIRSCFKTAECHLPYVVRHCYPTPDTGE